MENFKRYIKNILDKIKLELKLFINAFRLEIYYGNIILAFLLNVNKNISTLFYIFLQIVFTYKRLHLTFHLMIVL